MTYRGAPDNYQGGDVYYVMIPWLAVWKKETRKKKYTSYVKNSSNKYASHTEINLRWTNYTNMKNETTKGQEENEVQFCYIGLVLRRTFKYGSQLF